MLPALFTSIVAVGVTCVQESASGAVGQGASNQIVWKAPSAAVPLPLLSEEVQEGVERSRYLVGDLVVELVQLRDHVSVRSLAGFMTVNEAPSGTREFGRSGQPHASTHGNIAASLYEYVTESDVATVSTIGIVHRDVSGVEVLVRCSRNGRHPMADDLGAVAICEAIEVQLGGAVASTHAARVPAEKVEESRRPADPLAPRFSQYAEWEWRATESLFCAWDLGGMPDQHENRRREADRILLRVGMVRKLIRSRFPQLDSGRSVLMLCRPKVVQWLDPQWTDRGPRGLWVRRDIVMPLPMPDAETLSWLDVAIYVQLLGAYCQQRPPSWFVDGTACWMGGCHDEHASGWVVVPSPKVYQGLKEQGPEALTGATKSLLTAGARSLTKSERFLAFATIEFLADGGKSKPGLWRHGWDGLLEKCLASLREARGGTVHDRVVAEMDSLAPAIAGWVMGH